MRLVFVNHAHPDVPHVSGMRLGYFSRDMASRGHRVVLLTCALNGREADVHTPRELASRLAQHDWAVPFILAIRPVRTSAPRRRWPRLLERGITFWQFVRYDGVHTDWSLAARDWVRPLATAFRPHLVWGTFGNTTNLALAQATAHAARCPWVIDVKDNWATFLRPGIRELMAWRFGDAAGVTSNAEHHRCIASKWLRTKRTTVIYSGVASCFLTSSDVAEESPTWFLLVGSTREQTNLAEFLRGVRAWLDRLPVEQRRLITFAYIGADHATVQAHLERATLPCAVRVLPYLAIDEFASRCKSSFANCYLWSAHTFHHKLLELLTCGRPVLSFPGEADESRQLAAKSATPFVQCTSTAELIAALDEAWTKRLKPPAPNDPQPWQWSDRGQALERFFIATVSGASS